MHRSRMEYIMKGIWQKNTLFVFFGGRREVKIFVIFTSCLWFPIWKQNILCGIYNVHGAKVPIKSMWIVGALGRRYPPIPPPPPPTPPNQYICLTDAEQSRARVETHIVFLAFEIRERFKHEIFLLIYIFTTNFAGFLHDYAKIV
jgi:hypothetical protein